MSGDMAAELAALKARMAASEQASDNSWVMSMAFVVLTMQAGFGMLEAGADGVGLRAWEARLGLVQAANVGAGAHVNRLWVPVVACRCARGNGAATATTLHPDHQAALCACLMCSARLPACAAARWRAGVT